MRLFGKKYECKVCEIKFRSESELIEHDRVHVGEAKEDHSGHEHFNCTSCGMSFHSKDELKQHSQKSHM